VKRQLVKMIKRNNKIVRHLGHHIHLIVHHLEVEAVVGKGEGREIRRIKIKSRMKIIKDLKRIWIKIVMSIGFR